MNFGLLPISQFALHFYNRIVYHPYNSLALNEEHNIALVKDLGQKKIMIMNNHGTLTCGSTIHEAMFYTHHLEQACKVQIAALSAGYNNLIMLKKEIAQKSVKDLLSFEDDLGKRDWLALKRTLNK